MAVIPWLGVLVASLEVVRPSLDPLLMTSFVSQSLLDIGVVRATTEAVEPVTFLVRLTLLCMLQLWVLTMRPHLLDPREVRRVIEVVDADVAEAIPPTVEVTTLTTKAALCVQTLRMHPRFLGSRKARELMEAEEMDAVEADINKIVVAILTALLTIS